MKGSMKVTGSTLSPGVISLLLLSLVFTGCAKNSDIRMDRDHTSGTTERSPSDYMVCVKDGIQSGSKTFLLEEGGSVKLFVDSTDPDQATGLVEVSGTGKVHSFSAHQRDAWYDHGRLLDAALMCSKA